MINTFLAIALILTPFLLVFFFKNKKEGFLCIFNLFVLFHLLISLVTQSFGIFNYGLIILINTIISLIIIFKFFKEKIKIKIDKPNYWILIFFSIIFFQLWSVHNLYTGTITTTQGYQEVENFEYKSPYFSDEWITVLLAKHSIETGELPTKNPMNYDMPIVNLLIPYFSFISNFFLIFNLDLISQYYLAPLLTGLLVTIFSFILIRTFKVKLFPALLATISITYITNGANLPGIWYLLPYTLGLIMFINTLIFIRLDNKIFVGISSMLSVILYPPITIFVLPSVLFYIYKKTTKEIFIRYSLIIFGILSLIAFIIFSIGTGNLNIVSLVKQVFTEYIFREGVEDGIPSYLISNIIPVLIIFLAGFSYYKLYKEKILEFILPISIGLGLWIFYTTTTKVFFIEYPRVVTITSILLVIISSLGINFFWNKYVEKNNRILTKIKGRDLDLKTTVMIISTIIIVFYSFSYTKNNDWSELVLVIDKKTNTIAHPASPANEYLTKEDTNAFKSISGERFISNDWKSLVLGIATDNIPMNTKSSIISNNYLAYPNFSSQYSDCATKKQIVSDLKVKYAYVPKIDCSGFREIKKTSQGLFLYKIIE